jgi:hypothetical protein
LHFVGAAGRAMIDVLPQLAGGCVNYWEAGNWALNDEAEPKGPSGRNRIARCICTARQKPASTDPSWKWGESPRFRRSPRSSRGGAV